MSMSVSKSKSNVEVQVDVNAHVDKEAEITMPMSTTSAVCLARWLPDLNAEIPDTQNPGPPTTPSVCLFGSRFIGPSAVMIGTSDHVLRSVYVLSWRSVSCCMPSCECGRRRGGLGWISHTALSCSASACPFWFMREVGPSTTGQQKTGRLYYPIKSRKASVRSDVERRVSSSLCGFCLNRQRLLTCTTTAAPDGNVLRQTDTDRMLPLHYCLLVYGLACKPRSDDTQTRTTEK
jgi:hypothetical protein